MKKSFLTSLCALCTLFLIPSAVKATDYTIETIPAPATPVLSKALPFVPQSSTGSSVTQQVYLASELTALGATAGDITGIKFYYGGYNNNTSVPSLTRTIKIYITELATDSLEMYEIAAAYSPNYRFKFKNPGTSPVHEGNITTEAISAGEVKALSINFNKSSYAWDGSKNVLLTVYDVTNTAYTSSEANLRFVLKTTEHARFVHFYWTAAGDHNASEYLGSSLNGMVGESFTSGSTGTAQNKQVRGHRFIPKTTFSISTTIPAPTSPTSSSITSSSATIGWTAAAGAESYEVRYGTTSGSLGDATNVGNVTSYNLSELEDGVTYYFQIRTKIGTGYSAWTDEVHFETPATTIDYKDIDFSKWTSTTTMPTSGAYYLRNNVGLSASVTLEGNLQLCLHGKTLYTSTYHIIVPDGKTLSIFNDTGDGLINGGFLESLGHGGIIEIQDGGTLIISEGQVMNVAANDSYAIYNNGNLQLSGAPTIVGESAGIYLGNSKIITISGELTNSTPYSVNKALVGDFTSGWNTNMGSANPADYFSSANASFGVARNGNEARMVKALDWYESTSNSSIGDNSGQMVNVSMTRSILTSAHYNTICLPFALSAAQMEEIFGAGYDLEEFVSASLNEGILNLLFNQVDALVAGKPYLLKPAISVTNPSFEGVTIGATSPVDQTSDTYVSFHGTFAPTELTGGNKNILFLGANNELFWPTSTGNINGFRAYFELKGDAVANAVQARIGRAESQTTAIENQHSHIDNHKYMKDGQLLIERNGVIYNAQGQTIK